MYDIRPMRPDEEAEVRRLFRLAHSRRPDQAKQFYFLNPTLVAVRSDGKIAGHASMAVDNQMVCWLRDTVVNPRMQGQGIGGQLMDARIAVATELGCRVFIGAVDPDNTPMQQILQRRGFHACQTMHDGRQLWVRSE